MRYVSALLALVLVAGCATAPPTRFLTLDMRPTGAERPPVAFELGRILVAESLSGREILIQTSPTEVEYYAAAQWVASLGELVSEKLLAEFPQPESPRGYCRLDVEIRHFEQVDTASGAEARVQIVMRGDVRSVASSRSETLGSVDKTYEVSLPVPSDAPALRGLAETLSRCVEEIAGQLAVDFEAALPEN